LIAIKTAYLHQYTCIHTWLVHTTFVGICGSLDLGINNTEKLLGKFANSLTLIHLRCHNTCERILLADEKKSKKGWFSLDPWVIFTIYPCEVIYACDVVLCNVYRRITCIIVDTLIYIKSSCERCWSWRELNWFMYNKYLITYH